ncbi:MAG: hypothetical protein AAF961_15140 [Planctomycetota bacterium]
MKCVLLSADLILASAAQGLAQRFNANVVVTGACPDAAARCADLAPRYLLIDLRLPGLDLESLVRAVRSANDTTKIIACGPHVHQQRLAAAIAAGCDEVITRGQFEGRLAELLGNEPSSD